MKFKRAISVVTLIALCAGTVGCNSNNNNQPASTAAPETPASTPSASTEPASDTNSGEATNNEGQLTDEKVTFKVFTQVSGATVENIETNAFSDWYEDKTNVHIDWEIVTSGAQQQIPLKIAAGDLPDAFFGNLSDVQISTYSLVDNIFVPLEDAIEKGAPNIQNMLAESEIARQYSYLPDGHIYSLLRVVDTFNERITKRCWVYEPWLDTLGIDLPETTDAFYDMLVAFRDEDPNGNGIQDEIPLAGALMSNPANNEPESYILNSFVFYDGVTYLELDGDTVKYIGDTEEYREGLRYMNKLYKEGLLSSETWTQDRKGLQSAVEGGDENILGTVTAMYWGHFSTENGPTGRDKEFTAVPVLEGPGGVRNAYDRGTLVNNGKMCVTTACEDVDLFVRWADWFFDADAMMESGYSANYGPQGVGWDYAEPGEMTADGVQAKYKYLRAPDEKQNDNWFQTEPYYESADFINSIAYDDMNRKEAFGGLESKEKYVPYSAFEKRLPYMYLPLDNLDETVALKDLLLNTSTGEINVFRNKFITGELSIENDWDSYVNTIQKIGIDEYVEIYQKMYDDFLEVQASSGF